jgi:hypothetical protein
MVINDLFGFVLFILVLAFPAMVLLVFLKTRRPKRSNSLEIDQVALNAAEQELKSQGEKEWVVLKRCHGPAYTHNAMSEIVSYLAAEGIEATYDVYGISSADMGVTNFILKVLAKDEVRASKILSEME